MVSPFNRGGYVCSEVFDHTSLMRFIEKRFGVEVPRLSAEQAVLDALAGTLDVGIPYPLPKTNAIAAQETTTKRPPVP